MEPLASPSGRGSTVATAAPSPPSLSSPPLPARPGQKREAGLSLLGDPLIDLCPSLHSIQSLCQLPRSSMSEKDESLQKKRLEKALLRAASNGDIELISWACNVKRNREGTGPEVEALKQVEWGYIRDEDGTGPLNLAASSGHADIVQILVQNGANVDERDASGWTPLMWATNCSNLPLVSFLLSHGADIEAKSGKGATCEDFILSSTPAAGASQTGMTPSRLARPHTSSLQSPLSPHSSDRQLIADLVFEHQQTALTERANRERDSLRHGHLRNPSTSSSQDSGTESVAQSSLAPPPSTYASSSKSAHSRNSSVTLRRLMGKAERTQLVEAELRARELAEGRKRALLDVAVMMEVDYSDLVGEPPCNPEGADERSEISKRREKRRERAGGGKLVHSGLASGCGAIEVGGDPLSLDFDFDSVRLDQMLVFGESQVRPLLHRFITEAKPTRAPWVARSKPANVLYMCIRYACSLPDEDLLEEVIFGAVDGIEAKLYAHPTEMTHLAFWMYNCMLLLHYMQRDKTLQESEAMQEYTPLLADLINEIYVFIVRDMERRMDKVMDAAILDHNPIPGFEDVRFEGEWSFIKTLTGSVKRASQAGGQGSPSGKRPLSQLFGSDSTPLSPKLPATTPDGGGKRDSGRQSLAFTPTLAMAELREPSLDASASDLLAKPLPRTITQLLTSTLHILQLYEVNPSVIVQALSQVFFWVGCELFNRVISQRKYLCKSKAMQIRLNISALEDWVKTNALPLSIVNQHLCKLTQLISWLLCQSSLTEFDGLIATMQGLKELNPNQLKRVVKDYRHEVGETRIHPDCLAYLDQLQTDLDKRQEQEVMDRSQSGHSRSGTATQSHPNGRQEGEGDGEGGEEGEEEDEEELENGDLRFGRARRDDTMDSGKTQTAATTQEARKNSKMAEATQRAIDRLFEAGQSMNNYVPPHLPPPSSSSSTSQRSFSLVLLNSREMLPFALPSQTNALIVSPGDAFGFGRGHFMGTGTPSLKSFRRESLLGGGGGGGGARGDSSSIAGSPALTSSASSDAESCASQSSQSSRLYPLGKGLSAGAYWQPVPILPEDTLEEIQVLMKAVEQESRLSTASAATSASRRTSVDTGVGEATIESPTLALDRSPLPLSPSLSLSPSSQLQRGNK